MPNLFCDLDDFIPGGLGGLDAGDWFLHLHGPFGTTLEVASDAGGPPKIVPYPHCSRERVDIEAVRAWAAEQWAIHGHRATGPLPAIEAEMWPTVEQVLADARSAVLRAIAELERMRDGTHLGRVLPAQARRTLEVNVGQRRQLTTEEAARQEGGYPAFRSCLTRSSISYGHYEDVWMEAIRGLGIIG